MRREGQGQNEIIRSPHGIACIYCPYLLLPVSTHCAKGEKNQALQISCVRSRAKGPLV